MLQRSVFFLFFFFKQGQNLVLNMNDHGFVVCVYNRTTEKVDQFLANEAKGERAMPSCCQRDAGGNSEYFTTFLSPFAMLRDQGDWLALAERHGEQTEEASSRDDAGEGWISCRLLH